MSIYLIMLRMEFEQRRSNRATAAAFGIACPLPVAVQRQVDERIPAGKAGMAACTDEADWPVPGAERAFKGYPEEAMDRGKTQ